jgi:hypothetical protein
MRSRLQAFFGVAITLASVAPGTAAHAGLEVDEPVQIRLVTDGPGPSGTGSLWPGALIDNAPGWHVYWAAAHEPVESPGVVPDLYGFEHLPASPARGQVSKTRV